MSQTRDFLRSIGLPPGDLNDLPDSEKRFPDGAQYRVEIPSTEGPRCLEAVLEEANRLEVRVHRVSQGSGVFLQTDAELDEMAATAAAARVEVISVRTAECRLGRLGGGTRSRRRRLRAHGATARSRSSPLSTTRAERPPTASAAS